MIYQRKRAFAVVVSVLVFSAIFVSAFSQNSDVTVQKPNGPAVPNNPGAPLTGGSTSGSSSGSAIFTQTTSTSPYDLLEDDINEFCDAIKTQPDSAFKYPSEQRKKTLCNKLLNGFLGEVQTGNYSAALDILEEIRSKMDGDPGHTDNSQGHGHHKQPHYAGNDWVVDESVRNNLTQYIDNIENADYDNDGLSFWDEVTTHGTDPLNPDTDGDGMPDGWEVNNGFDPLDPTDASNDFDNDELTNYQELQYGTDPLDPDTDDDSNNNNFLDGREVRYWEARGLSAQLAGQYANTPDVDADGQLDGFEAYFGSKHVWWFEAEDFKDGNAQLWNDPFARVSPNQPPLSAVKTTHSSGELIWVDLAVVGTPIEFQAFGPGYAGWAHPAIGDVNGDGVNEIVIARGPVGESYVKVVDLAGNYMGHMNPYGWFDGGVFVATCDVDGDNDDEIVTGPGHGGGPHMKIYNFTDAAGFSQILEIPPAVGVSFFGGTIGSYNGLNVACGDLDNDGAGEVIVAESFHGSNIVAALDIVVDKTVSPWLYSHSHIGSISNAGYAHKDSNFNGGQYVSSGNLDNDPNDEILVSCWVRGDGYVYKYDNDLSYMGEFEVYTLWSGGVRTAVGDITGDGIDEIITSHGPGAPADERIYDANGRKRGQFAAPVPGYAGGAMVATGNLRGDPNTEEILVAPECGGVNTKAYEFDFPPSVQAPPLTYKLYVKARSISATPSADRITLRITGTGGFPVLTLADLTLAANYRWYSTPSISVNQRFELHAIDLNPAGNVVVDKFAFVEFDDVQATVTTTTATNNRLQFPSASSQVFNVVLPVGTQSVPANATSAAMTLVGQMDAASQQFPARVTFDAGDDGDIEWSGVLSSFSIPMPDFSGALTRYVFLNQGLIAGGTISVPIRATSNSPGDILMNNINIRLGPDITDNADFDTDTDGLRDGWTDSNGNNVCDAGESFGEKGDGAGNCAYGTHAFHWDTDNDGLSDSAEISQGTGMFDWDSDNDSLSDGREVAIGTSPLNQDTDGDLMTDDWEVNGGGVGLQNPNLRWNAALLPGQEYFALHLTVAFNWDATPAYANTFIAGMRSASDFLYDVTDGYLLIGTITLDENVQAGNPIWDNADIQVTAGDGTAAADVLGITNPAQHVYLRQTMWGQQPNNPWYWQTIVHELGHYALGLYDEYYDARGPDHLYPTITVGGMQIQNGPPGLMTSQFVYTEMTTPTDYNNWVIPAGFLDTHQNRTLHEWPLSTTTDPPPWANNPNAGEACWETFFRYYNSVNGVLSGLMGGRNYQIPFDLDNIPGPDNQFFQNYQQLAGPVDPDVGINLIVFSHIT